MDGVVSKKPTVRGYMVQPIDLYINVGGSILVDYSKPAGEQSYEFLPRNISVEIVEDDGFTTHNVTIDELVLAWSVK